ncbi:hypothetical protein BP6252_01411 [Coleophoma cylindrospora]|uniref:Uncharacterized protein n=1 Tax=Coleophoma cylindrospora TaxID=1849047 RepID=A0A3D8SST0_9HELO|nr:hypothetical protein BP6252_01411 [Coleophoma cylindrospora]
MDDNSRRRRQNEAPSYPAPDPRFGDQGQARGFSSSTAERYRPAPLNTSPSAARGAGGATAYSGYYQEPAPTFPAALPPNNLQYQQGYPQDQRQQQNFAGYNPDLMYNVTQQATQSTTYDTNQQFQARQPAAMQMLSDVAAPYFPSDPSTAAAPPGLQHHASSSSSTVYPQQQQQQQQHQSPAQQGYSGTMTMGGIPHTAPDIMDQSQYEAQGPGMEEAYNAYQTALKEIFQNVINGRLAEASQSLLEVSEWLLGHVGDLGLIVDEVGLHADRIRLWNEFNTAWLSIFQRQKDILESGQGIRPPQSLMTQDFINKMAKDLVRMCDNVEKHGLVDYQYGVAEEQIINVLTECLDLQESLDVASGGSAAGRPPP